MGTKLCVGNLNFTTTEDALKTAFAADGRTVREVAIPSDRETGRPCGFAFVTMGSGADAKAAIEALDRKELDGRRVRVSPIPFHILSFSGGGIRGIFQAYYLRTIAQHFKRPLNQCFDLVAGTSTGAIIAFGIALGVDPQRVVDLFRKHGPRIFPQGWHSWLGSGPRYSDGPLREALSEVFNGKRLKDCRCEVVIPATVLDNYRTRTFSTIHNEIDPRLAVIDVILASCAAPLFFPAVRMTEETSETTEETSETKAETSKTKEERTYVDGGLWANNPSLVAVMQAHRHGKNIPLEEMRVISVGNGEVPEAMDRDQFNRMRRARMLEPVLDMMFSMQSQMADQAAAILVNGDKGDPQLNGEKNFLRVNVTLKTPIALDDTESALKILPGLAEGIARNNVTRFRTVSGIGD